MKLSEYQRSRSFFDLGKRSLSFQTYNLFFTETAGRFGTMGMKIYTNELGHKISTATMTIYGKNLKNIRLQTIDR